MGRHSGRNFATLPPKADAVIVGGGVIGSSVAYHLSKKNGWKNIVVLEQVHHARAAFSAPSLNIMAEQADLGYDLARSWACR